MATNVQVFAISAGAGGGLASARAYRTSIHNDMSRYRGYFASSVSKPPMVLLGAEEAHGSRSGFAAIAASVAAVVGGAYLVSKQRPSPHHVTVSELVAKPLIVAGGLGTAATVLNALQDGRDGFEHGFNRAVGSAVIAGALAVGGTFLVRHVVNSARNH